TMAGKNVQQLIFALHPTPAVCGTPTGAAKNFIAANENYQREFYTGYLGLIGATRSALFVNIRCMKIAGGTASVYAGGGITAQSDPEREWRETQHKMQAVLQLLADFF
ncbi:MAG: chorismate-binding protein, partial [Marinirhabdus sp.]